MNGYSYKRSNLAPWFLLLSIALVACDGGSNLDAGLSDAGPSDASIPSDASPPDTVSVQFVILSGDARDGTSNPPIANATVAIDVGDTRDESLTDADGNVTFDVDWSQNVALTIDADGFPLNSYAHLRESSAERRRDADGSVRLFVVGARAPELVTIRGTLRNVDDPTHRFNVVAGAPYATVYNAIGPDWEVQVPRGVPVSITALEFSAVRTSPVDLEQTFHQVAMVRVDAPSEDAVVDIDFAADAIATETTTGTLTLPGGSLEGSGRSAYGLVRSREGGLSDLLGAMTVSALSATDPNTLEYTMEWWAPPGVTPVTQIWVNREDHFTVVNSESFPSGGPMSAAFLPAPTLVSPAFGEAHSLYAPFELSSQDSTVAPSLAIHLDDGSETVQWLVFGAPGESMLEVPRPPSSVSATELFPVGIEVFVRPRSCELGVDQNLCHRLSLGSRVFDIQP